MGDEGTKVDEKREQAIANLEKEMGDMGLHAAYALGLRDAAEREEKLLILLESAQYAMANYVRHELGFQAALKAIEAALTEELEEK
jgi:hypothetical protein